MLDSDVIVKILGMRWDPIKGERSFAERNILILVIVTKMTILKYSSQIYDPLGLLQDYGMTNTTGTHRYLILYLTPGTSLQDL